MKNMPPAKNASLLASFPFAFPLALPLALPFALSLALLLLTSALAPLSLAPLSRAQPVTINSSTVINSATELPPLSQVTFAGRSGTIEVAADVTFDGGGADSNHLTLGSGVTGAFMLDDGVTLTFTNNVLTAAGNGGAITGSGANLVFSIGTDAQLVFSNNKVTTASDGGAISLISGTLLIDASAGGFLFTNNTGGTRGGAILGTNNSAVLLTNGTFSDNWAANGNGGAMLLLNNTLARVTDVLFDSNTAAASGAVHLNTSATLIAQSSTFLNNVATANGGAIAIQGASTVVMNGVDFIGNTAATNGGAVSMAATSITANFTDVLFKGNSAPLGGAIFANSANVTVNVTNALFQSNTATIYGGALGTGTANTTICTWNLTDTSLLDNYATLAGGAIWLNGPITLNYTVTTSATIAGNKAGSGAAATASGIQFANYTTPSAIFSVTTGARLDMLDPMTSNAGNSGIVTITLNGGGLWNLGGQNNLAAANAITASGNNSNVNFTISTGTLHLYKAGETSYNGAPVATGNIAIVTTTGSFNLAATGALSAGGGNTILAPAINFAAGATLEFDLLGAAQNSAALLTLNAAAFNTASWNQNINLLDLGSLHLLSSATFNLIALAGAGATGANLFGDASFNNLSNFFSTDSLAGYTLGYSTDGLTLQLLYTYTAAGGNRVLLWNGADGAAWTGANWLAAADTAGPAVAFTPGDIVNLADTPAGAAAGGSGSIAINATGLVVAGMYVSGTENHTLTGAGLAATATAGDLTGDAATGQLILGARAAADGSTIDTGAGAAFTGTLTLANAANNFAGGIEIDSGALVGNAANLGTTGTDGAAVGIAIAAPGTLVFDQAASATYAAPITGAGALVKTNTAALTLAADNSAFGGTTSVSSGALLLAASGGTTSVSSAAALGGDIRVANGATFGGSGAAGAVTLDTGATLQIGLRTPDTGLSPSPSASGQTLTLTSNLNLSSGALLDYTNIANTLVVGGSVSLLGTGTINLGTLTTGAFALIDAAGGYGAGFDPTAFDIYYNGALFDTSHYTWDLAALATGTLWLDITSLTLPANNILTWTNATGDAAWLGSANWLVPSFGVTTTFAQGDIVNLADISGGTTSVSSAPVTLDLATTATASAIYVSGTASYAITGAGAITTATGVGILSGSAAATGKLVLGKTVADDAGAPATAVFTGTLDLAGQDATVANNFSGGIEINTGALRVATTGQLGTTLSNLAFTGTGALIIAGDMTLDSSVTGTENRLIVPAGVAASFMIEDGATLTFSRNTAPVATTGSVTGTAGGAIYIAAGASLTLTAGAGAQAVFFANTSNADGGAISVLGATLTLTGTAAGAGGGAAGPHGSFLFTANADENRGGAILATTNATVTIDNATFQGNTTGVVTGGTNTANGGAITAMNSSTLTLTNVLFTTNTAQTGGAIFNNSNSRTLVQSATFASNYAFSNGGAIGIQNPNTAGLTGSLTLRDVAFTSNTSAGNGGAISIQTNNSFVDATRVLFDANTAANQGGAVNITNNNSGAFTDAIFTNNTSGTAGGAIYQGTGTLTLNVTDGATSLFAGNQSGATPAPNSIYLGGAATLAIAIAAGGSLDMPDPLAAANAAITITQTGAGVWNLGGANTLGATTAAAINFTVASGTLHLYRAGETATAPGAATYTAATGNLAIAGAASSFTLGPAATLSAGGANTITAPTINLAPASTIALDLLGLSPGNSPILTLNATTLFNPNGWGQIINLLNAPAPGAFADGSTFNLIALGNGNVFADADYLTLAGVPDASLYHLQLDPANSSILQLYYGSLVFTNNVLVWTGAIDNTWGAANWAPASDLATSATYSKNDIVNLADIPGGPTSVSSSTINVDIPGAGVTIAGMAVSGTTNYTITGNPITTAPAGGAFTGSAAATGQLILGAYAPDADTLLTSDSNSALQPFSPSALYTGTLTLANTSNNFQNGIIINTGALVGNAANLATGAAAGIAIAAAGSLTFDQPTDAVYNSPIAGSGALAKTGPGALTLAANSSSFGGTTSVSSGALLLNAAALGGAIHVANAATFGGSGTAGAVTLAPGATLQVGLRTQDTGLSPSGQTLTLTSNLNLSAGAALNYTSNDNTLLVTGLITQNGASTINLLGATLAVGGTYSLIDAAGGWGGAGFDDTLFGVTYKGTLLDPGADYLLATDSANLLWLTILNIPIVGNNVLTWNGAAGDNLWLASANWTTQGVTKAFYQGDIVNLADATPPPTSTLNLNLTSTATVAAIYISGSTNYALAGPGAIIATTDTAASELTAAGAPAATGKLILGAIATDASDPLLPSSFFLLPFTGTLDLTALTGTNNFAGGVEINTGALRVATTAQLGAPLSNLSFTGAGALIAAASMTFDGAGAAANRLTLNTGASATFVVEDGVTLTFANNNAGGANGGAMTLATGANLAFKLGAGAQLVFSNNQVGNATSDGGAIAINGGTLAIDATAPGAGFLFANNTGGNRGGAIFAQTNAYILLSGGTFSGNSNATNNGGAIIALGASQVILSDIVFVSNTGNQSGAIHINTNSLATAQNALFLNNVATTSGGAVSAQTSSTITMTDSQFIGNTAATNGGAIASAGTGSTLSFTNVLFQANTAQVGGAFFGNSAGCAINITNALFQANTATVDGGAIATGTNNATAITWNLTDISLLDNTAGSLGGAIYMNGPVALNYTIATSATIAGNKAAGAPNGIYLAGSSATFALTIAAGAHLDMLDPMTAASAPAARNGAGLWNIGGNNTLGATTLNAGVTHLYRAGETSGAYAATTGNLNLGSANLTLAAPATLSAGGGNTITAGAITLAPGATLALDMAAATPGVSILTLNSALFNTAAWNQNLALLNLDELDASNNDIFNLITLAGSGASANPFTTAAFNNLADITGLLDGCTLQIANSGSTLQLLYRNDNLVNRVLTWTGATDANWRALNWLDAATGAPATYAKGDIVNLANIPGGTTSVSSATTTSVSSATITINPAAGVTIAGMFVSGTQNYIITGNAITTSSTVGSLAGAAAATGQLVLGANAAADAATITTAAYTGTLTLANTAGVVSDTTAPGSVTGANNFENGIDIRSGALVGNADTLRAGTTAATGVAIAPGASLTFDQATDAAYSTPLTGAGSLTKTNTGALTLTANNASFGGTTSVSSGALLLAAASGGTTSVSSAAPPPALGGAINVASNATFGGSGTAGSVTLAPGATLQIGLTTPDSGLSGSSSGSGSLTLTSNLNLSPGAMLDYAAITNQLLVGGAATLGGDATINLGTIATGSYSLINATGGLTGFNTNLLDVSFKGSLLDATDYTLAATANQLWITFATLPNNVITWTNATGNGLWLAAANWKIANPSGAATARNFKQGDIVNLSGAGGTTSVSSAPVSIQLASTATTAGLYISGNASYALAGPGGITTDATAGVLAGTPAATGKLILGAAATDANSAPATAAFTGTLDLTGLDGANNFTGGIVVNSGALRVASAAQFGATLSQLTITTGTAAATAPAKFIFAGDTTLDAQGAPSNHLAITASTAAAFVLEDGVTLTIARVTNTNATGGAITAANHSILNLQGGDGSQYAFANNTTGATGDGGAISVANAALLTLGSADSDASFLFTNNSAQNRGGAIYGQTANIVIFNGSFVGNKSNTTGNGGAIAVLQRSNLTLTNVLFASNTGGMGGALLDQTNSLAYIQSATFTANVATGTGGGAIVVNGTSKVFVTDALFTSNNATGAAANGTNGNGGAILLVAQGAAADVTNALFQANAGNNGGAAALLNTNILKFTDVSFLDNTARLNGGAIYMIGGTYNASVDIEVSDNNTSIIAGNTSGAGAAATPNSVYMAAGTGGRNLIIGTGDGATLDMLDPMRADDSNGTIITKAGNGVWNLGGNNQLGAGATLSYFNLDITAGTLRLHRAGETVWSGSSPIQNPQSQIQNPYTAATGNITMTGASSLTLEAGATLEAAGGNTITAPGIFLDPASALAFDLLDAPPNAPAATSSLLTLNATTVLSTGGWTQTLSLLDLDTLSPSSDGAIYNLLTLTGSGALGGISPFYPAAAFASADTFALASPLPDDYRLQISADGQTLQLLYIAPVLNNTVLTWNGGAWLGGNWIAAGVSSTFNRGDIINLGGTTSVSSAALAVNTLNTATIAAMYVSGTANLTLTGQPIVADANATLLAGAPAATGKLTLGAIATDSGLLTPDSHILTPSTFSGTLTLSNSWNNFTGGIEILSGALVGNAQTLGAGATGIAIAATGTLTFAQPADATYAAPITGAGSLAKTGPATLTLAADNSSFGGTTSVSSGALLLAPAAGGTTSVSSAAPPAALGGDIQVAPAATFGGLGSAGAVTLAPNATLQIGLRTQDTGLSDQTSNLNLSNLNLSGGSLLDYTALGNTLTVGSGGVTALGAATINIPVFAATGTYDLGNIAALSAAQVTIAGAAQYADARSHATLATAPNGADLLLIATRDISRILTWTGAAGNNTWASTGSDWNDTTNQVKVFGAGDRVIFDDTGAASPAITIAPSGALVSDMIVDSTANYTITGGGITADATSAYAGEPAGGTTSVSSASIASVSSAPAAALAAPTASDLSDATGKLYKDSAGVLTLSTTTPNNFTGGIELNAGALALGGTTFAGGITTVAPGVTLQMTAPTAALNAATLSLAASSTITGNGTVRFDNLTLAGNGMVRAAIAASTTLTLSSTTPTYTFADAGFLKTGGGELQFNGAGAFGDSSVTQIDEGTVRLTGFTTGVTTVIPAAMLPLSAGGNYLYVPSATYAVTDFGGYITVPAANVYVVAGAATIPIAGGTYAMSGDVVIPGCTVTIGGVETTIASSTVVFPVTNFSTPAVTGTVIGNFVIIPTSSFTVPNYLMGASTVTQNMVLNGGALAFGAANAAATASGANGGNDNRANNWLGLRLIQGDAAANSVITGVNDVVYLGPGAFAPQLSAGLHVTIDAGDGVAVLANTANNFTGLVIADSGTLQVTDQRQLGTVTGTANAKIALNGGIVQFSAPINIPGDIAVRAALNTVVVDDGVNVTWTRIYRDAAFTPGAATLTDPSVTANSGTLVFTGAAFVKAGSGTFTLTGAFQANAMEVDAGRFIVTASSGLPNNNGPVVIKQDATYQLSQNLASGASGLGDFANGFFTPSFSGTITNAFYGSGTLDITNTLPVGYVLTNANTNIAAINITGANTTVALQAATFSPAGTITVDRGTLILANPTQTLGNVILRNNATMGFLMVNTSTTIGTNPSTATYVAKPLRAATLTSLTADGAGVPNLWFNTNIIDGYADHLTINTPVTGTFAINVINSPNFDNTPSTGVVPNARVDLELINSPASANGEFIVADNSKTIDIGLYKYAVTGTTTTINGADTFSVNITGNGDMSRTAAAIYTAAAMLPVSWFSELDSVTQRLGDLHLDNRDTTKAGFSAWMRGYGDKLNFNTDLTGSDFNETHYGAEAGVDYKFAGAGNWNLYLGAFMGYGQLQRNANTATATDATTKSTTDGAYLTLVSPAHGWYADAVVKFNRFDNQYTVTDPSSARSATALYYNWALGASLEIGKRQPLPYEWFITPSLQAAYTKISDQTYALTNGATASLASGATTRARLGFMFGRDFDTPNDGTLSVYLKAYYGHQWTTGGSVTIALPDGTPPGRFASKIDGLNLTAGAGLAWRFTKNTQVYFDYETTQTDYYTRPYGLNLGLRHLW